MPHWEKMQFPNETKFAQRIVSQRLKVFIKDIAALDLIEKVRIKENSPEFKLFLQLLTLKPQDRIDCDTALNHDFFWTDPMPEPLTKTLKTLDKSMFEYLVTNSVCTKWVFSFIILFSDPEVNHLGQTIHFYPLESSIEPIEILQLK